MASVARIQCVSVLKGSTKRTCRSLHSLSAAALQARKSAGASAGGTRNVGTTSNVSEWSFPIHDVSVNADDLSHRLKISQVPDHGSLKPKYRVRMPTTHTPTKVAEPVFEPHYSLFAKRPSRPFPPPFTPPNSFSDPLSRHPSLRGYSNGDDALLLGSKFIAVADGVGAWNTRVNGHAALWARLMVHFWSKEMDVHPEDPVACLQHAYETVQAATKPGEHEDDDGVKREWQGTTTFCGAVMIPSKEKTADVAKVGFLNIGDSQGFLIRPSSGKIEFKTEEQWHWFDCPRQLGTNSPDTPKDNAVYTIKDVQKGDIVLLATDGLMDNLWEDEILDIVMEGENEKRGGDWTAKQLMTKAMERGRDPFAESPYMERAIDGGLSVEGGKYDDISVLFSKITTSSS